MKKCVAEILIKILRFISERVFTDAQYKKYGDLLFRWKLKLIHWAYGEQSGVAWGSHLDDIYFDWTHEDWVKYHKTGKRPNK